MEEQNNRQEIPMDFLMKLLGEKELNLNILREQITTLSDALTKLREKMVSKENELKECYAKIDGMEKQMEDIAKEPA